MLCKQQRSQSLRYGEDEGLFHAVFPVFNESWDAMGDRDGAVAVREVLVRQHPRDPQPEGRDPSQEENQNRVCVKSKS